MIVSPIDTNVPSQFAATDRLIPLSLRMSEERIDVTGPTVKLYTAKNENSTVMTKNYNVGLSIKADES